MSSLMKEVDARTQLAGANTMEILLFNLGESEIYGINVFKVREVLKRPSLTRVPETDDRIEGMASIRGQMVPVVNLRRALGLPDLDGKITGNLILAEYNHSLHGLIVAAVERIIRLSWDQVKAPPRLVCSNRGGSVTAVTMLEDGRMVLILDVEKVLTDINPLSEEEYGPVASSARESATSDGGPGGDKGAQQIGKCVLFADDSLVARNQIIRTLNRLGLSYISCTTGREAWEQLVAMAEKASAEGRNVRDEIQMILTDIEMPEMDGFTLTRQVTSDPRFAGIAVVMHSSLTGVCNAEKGKAMGATDYVTKFDPKVLSEVIQRYC
jgi:two-component system chemotaxis response regulator CheV